MIRFENALHAWRTTDFEVVLKQEIAQLDIGYLPLQQGLSTGNYVADVPVSVSIHTVSETEEVIRVTAGIFFQGVIGGCSCVDDPTPDSEINEYCEVLLEIEKTSAITAVKLINQ